MKDFWTKIKRFVLVVSEGISEGRQRQAEIYRKNNQYVE